MDHTDFPPKSLHQGKSGHLSRWLKTDLMYWRHFHTLDQHKLLYSHVLHHNVLVGYEAIHTVVSPFPPVFWCPMVQEERGPFLEGELSWRPSNVVKLRYGFDLLHFCEERSTDRGKAQCNNRKGTVNPSKRHLTRTALTLLPWLPESIWHRVQTDWFSLFFQPSWNFSQTHKLPAITKS